MFRARQLSIPLINAAENSPLTSGKMTAVLFIGFEDIPQSMFANPRLTTIRQPLTETGEVAANTLLQKISGEAAGQKILRIEPELILREFRQSGLL